MNTDELRDLSPHVVAGAAGGEEADWRDRIAIERVPTWCHVKFDWIVKPRGTAEQYSIIEKAVELVRGEHPYAG